MAVRFSDHDGRLMATRKIIVPPLSRSIIERRADDPNRPGLLGMDFQAQGDAHRGTFPGRLTCVELLKINWMSEVHMHIVVHTSMVYRWRAPFIKTCSPETGKGVEPNMAGQSPHHD